MRFSAVALVFAALSATASAAPAAGAATTVSVSYDQTYNNANGDLNTVACSDGQNGLLTKGYTTFGSLPGFPNVGGASVIAGWNSAQCGTCWQLTYKNTTINVLAIDHVGAWNGTPSFNLALPAMNKLTNNAAVNLGRVSASATQVAVSNCH